MNLSIRNHFLSRAIKRHLTEAQSVTETIKDFGKAADKNNAVSVMVFGSLLNQCEEGVLESERYRLQLSHTFNDVTVRHLSPIVSGQDEVVALWKSNLAAITKLGKKLGISRTQGIEYVPAHDEAAA